MIVTVEELKAFIGTDLSRDDALITVALAAAIRGVNAYCQRSFDAVADDAVASARVYVPQGSLVRFHDCTEVTSISENGTLTAVDYYQLEPLNGLSQSGLSVPYEQARRSSSFWYADCRTATVSVVAKWGWPATPVEAKMAVLILGKDIASNKQVSFGIAAFTEYAGIRAKENPQVTGLLNDLRRVEAWGIA